MSNNMERAFSSIEEMAGEGELPHALGAKIIKKEALQEKKHTPVQGKGEQSKGPHHKGMGRKKITLASGEIVEIFYP